MGGVGMERNRSLWQLAGFGVTALGGTLLHFVYDWTNQSVLAALVSAVNESTWEHMKLLLVPMVLFAVLEHRFFPDVADFWCVKLCGMLAGLVTIPVLFYTGNGAFGKTPDWVNILIFFVAAAVSYALETARFRRQRPCRYPKLAAAAIVLLLLMFAGFTFVTPRIPLFRDPITGTYGRSTACRYGTHITVPALSNHQGAL